MFSRYDSRPAFVALAVLVSAGLLMFGLPAVADEPRQEPERDARATIVLGVSPLEDGSVPERIELKLTPAGEGLEDSADKPPAIVCGAGLYRRVCRIPAGTWHLRFSADGFVDQFRWDVTVEPGRAMDLPGLKFEPGAALSGYVFSRGLPVAGAEISVSPRALGQQRQESERRKLDQLRREMVTNEHGFFLLGSVAPGAYVVEARKAPLLPGRVTANVLAGQMTEIAEPPLELFPPSPVEIFVQPPVAPGGESWSFEIDQLDRGRQRVAVIERGHLPPGGWWSSEQLSPGLYRLSIGLRLEQRWITRELKVEPDMGPVVLDVPIVRVEGTVALGDRPIEGEVWFGQRRSDEAVKLESDDEGRFAGHLPRGGDWQVEVVGREPKLEQSRQVIEVEPRPGKTVAEVEIRLPDTRLAGIVVDEEGQPVRRALVNAQSLDEVVTLIRQSNDSDGRFEILGLPPGRTSIIAEASGREEGLRMYSDELYVELAEGREPGELRLVLRPELEIRGQIVDVSGRGVAGARISAQPLQVEGLPMFAKTSNAEGSFAVTVPAVTYELMLYVDAPGFAYRMLRLPASVTQPVIVPVSQQAGDLKVRLPVGFSFDGWRWNDPAIFILHEGVSQSLFFLRRGARSPEPGVALARGLEPGEYLACMARTTERFSILASPDRSTDCVGGLLTAGGELTLSLEDFGR